MIDILEIRKAIKSLLLTAHPRAYYQVAPKNVQYPYLIFDLPNSINTGEYEMFMLELDGWDQADDTTTLETMMAVADGQINKNSVILDLGADGKAALTFFRDTRLSLTDEEERIKRRKYIYQMRFI